MIFTEKIQKFEIGFLEILESNGLENINISYQGAIIFPSEDLNPKIDSKILEKLPAKVIEQVNFLWDSIKKQ